MTPTPDHIARFLDFACWDHTVHGKPDHRMYDTAAQRILARYPTIARHSLPTAIVCGELDEVQHILTTDPNAAKAATGSREWTPILYSTFTRFTHPQTIANGLAIARLLLDHGANPNDFYMAGNSHYTTLVGAAGQGEQDSPRQPYAPALFQLLLERGAQPFDIQVLYNTHFSGDVLWWLELIHNHTRSHDAWKDPTWSMLDMGGYGTGAYFLFRTAVQHNDLHLAEWLLHHGADPNHNRSTHPKFQPKSTILQDAQRHGLNALSSLLISHGAEPGPPVTDPELLFEHACFHQDEPAAKALLRDHPEFLQSNRALSVASSRDRPDILAFLLSLGFPLDLRDDNNQSALHEAAAANARNVARFLIEQGIAIDPVDNTWNSTPLGYASHYDHTEIMDDLSKYSRSVWTLAFRGYVDRLRAVLDEDPSLAKLTRDHGITPLWWLPDDETKAMEIVDLLLAHGADPAQTSKSGTTAADWARKRGMWTIAEKLDAAATP